MLQVFNELQFPVGEQSFLNNGKSAELLFEETSVLLRRKILALTQAAVIVRKLDPPKCIIPIWIASFQSSYFRFLLANGGCIAWVTGAVNS